MNYAAAETAVGSEVAQCRSVGPGRNRVRVTRTVRIGPRWDWIRVTGTIHGFVHLGDPVDRKLPEPSGEDKCPRI